MSEEDKMDPRNTIDFLIDHEDVSKEQQKVAEDILEIITQNESKHLPLKFTLTQIRNDYKIDEIPMMDISQSLWHEFTKDEKIGQSVQGYRQSVKDGKKVRIPHIAFSGDLDYLDDMMRRIITRINNLKKE